MGIWLQRAAWPKCTGRKASLSRAPRKVFEGEEKATAAILAGKVKAGDVVVIRGEVPWEGPGCRNV